MEGLAAVAQTGGAGAASLELRSVPPRHPPAAWCSTWTRVRKVAFTTVIDAAKEVRDRLAELGLVSFCKTTGGKGLHVVTPLARASGANPSWAEAKASRAGRLPGDGLPRRRTATSSTWPRSCAPADIFLDYLRNDRLAHRRGPRSPRRARPGRHRVDAADLGAGEGRVGTATLHGAQCPGVAGQDQGLGGILRLGTPARRGHQAPGALSGGLPASGLDTEPMEAKVVDALPEGPAWQFEPKWDGFRCLAYKAGGEVDLRAKSGKPLGRYFPEMIEALRQARVDDFVLDGELMVPCGDTLSFGALQDRVHPAASRIRKLAAETPALLVLFDCLAAGSAGPMLGALLAERRAALDRVMTGFVRADRVRLSPFTRDRRQAGRWLERAHGALDGVIAKRLDKPYATGKRDMLKVKTHRTADCVVGGFRYGKDSRQAASLLLGLFDADGKLDHVGFTSRHQRRRAPRVDAASGGLAGRSGGFTGDAPGGPSPLGDREIGRLAEGSVPSWWSKSATTKSPTAVSATARCCSAGVVRTRRRGNAPGSNSARRCGPGKLVEAIFVNAVQTALRR